MEPRDQQTAIMTDIRPNDFVPVTEEEAMRIVDRIRREAAASG